MTTSATALPEPMSLGRILDRSLRLAPRVFTCALAPLLLQAAFQVAFETLSKMGYLGWMFAVLVPQGILAFYISLSLAFIASEYWLGRETTLAAVTKRITWRLVGRVLLVGLITIVAAMLWSILLIIPGIVYVINRLLAWYIVLFEDATPAVALKKSKYLMTRGGWFDTKAPLVRVLGISTVVWVTQFFATLLAGGSSYLLGWGSLDQYAAYGILFIAYVFSQFAMAFSAIIFVGFYYDVRARYEGMDLETGIQQLTGGEVLA